MPGIMETSFADVLPQSGGGVCGLGCCSVVGFVLMILFFPCTVIQLGQFQYGLAKNKITGTVDLTNYYTPGRYWIGFWKEFITFPSTLNTIEFSDEKPEEGVQALSKLRSRDKDGKQIFLDISIQYRLNKESIGQIYKDMTTLYEDVYISDMRDRLSKAANLFAIEEAWTDYKGISDSMFARCVKMLSERGAECWGLQLNGVSLDSKYEDKLIQTQVQKQAQLTASAQLLQAQVRAATGAELASFTKDIKVIDAQATANRINIERRAVSEAEANLVEAQAGVLKIIKDTVNLNNASKGMWIATGANDTRAFMSDQQLVVYQKYVMLQRQEQSHIIVNLADGFGSLNAASARNLMQGNSRRLNADAEL